MKQKLLKSSLVIVDESLDFWGLKQLNYEVYEENVVLAWCILTDE